MRAEEALDLFKTSDERRRGELAQHAFTLALGVQARIQNSHDPAIIVRTQ